MNNGVNGMKRECSEEEAESENVFLKKREKVANVKTSGCGMQRPQRRGEGSCQQGLWREKVWKNREGRDKKKMKGEETIKKKKKEERKQSGREKSQATTTIRRITMTRMMMYVSFNNSVSQSVSQSVSRSVARDRQIGAMNDTTTNTHTRKKKKSETSRVNFFFLLCFLHTSITHRDKKQRHISFLSTVVCPVCSVALSRPSFSLFLFSPLISLHFLLFACLHLTLVPRKIRSSPRRPR